MSLFTKEKSRVKRSVDLSVGVDVALDEFRELVAKHGTSLSRGAAIDVILSAVLQLKPSQANRLLKTATHELGSAQAILDSTSLVDALSYRNALKEVETWKQVTELLDILGDGYEDRPPMRSIGMKGSRVLVVPDSDGWILVNEEDAPDCTEATIVEVKNGAQFNAPHFVYFNNGKAATHVIDAAIIEIYPPYKDILAARVEPKRDESGSYVNLDELKNAPIPGYFPALPDDPMAGNPYGVVLIDGEKGEND